MPAHYAHYRFGDQLLPTLPANVSRPILRFRRLFDLGLQGPDLFFYYNILTENHLQKQGKKFHAMTGQEFFGMICRRLRFEPTEAGQAYLYGLLAHYCLDRACHPLIQEAIEDGKVGHIELETEFDRHLMTLDGIAQPEIFDNSRHMTLTKGECVTISKLYPGIQPGDVLQSVQTMAAVTKFLATPKGNQRAWMQKAAKKVVNKFTPFIMGETPNRNCAQLAEDLKTHYDEAAALYPALLEQLTAHMTYNAPLGEEFEKTFG